MEEIEDLTAELSQVSFENLTFENNRITADITPDEAVISVIPLNYSRGWSATVDGLPAQLLKVDTLFMGLALEKGSHHIELTYQTPGLEAGMYAQIAGIILFVIVVIGSFVIRNRKADYN